MPSQAYDEWRRVPVGFMETVIEYRRYAEAYFANKRDPKGFTASDMRTVAFEIEMGLAEEEMRQG